MSWQDDKMAEQYEADALFTMGEAEWRDTFEDRWQFSPDYEYETRKTNYYELHPEDFYKFDSRKINKAWERAVRKAKKRAKKDPYFAKWLFK